jgi:hypothetical protein
MLTVGVQRHHRVELVAQGREARQQGVALAAVRNEGEHPDAVLARDLRGGIA